MNYCRLTQSVHFLSLDFTQHEFEQFWRYVNCNGQGNFMRWGKSHLTYQLPYNFNYMIKFCTVISSSCEIRFELVLEKEDTKTPDHNTFYWHVFLTSPSATVTNRDTQNDKIQRCSVLCTECPKFGCYAINHVITPWTLRQTCSSIKFRKKRFLLRNLLLWRTNVHTHSTLIDF